MLEEETKARRHTQCRGLKIRLWACPSISRMRMRLHLVHKSARGHGLHNRVRVYTNALLEEVLLERIPLSLEETQSPVS